MNVLVVGGGPGGLYAAILLRKAHPGWRIQVAERNPADATYGWGIVFSDRTLASFREADPPTFREITDRFVIWDTIEIRQNGAVTRCGGNVFSGMSRKLLLEILQGRCRELGVELRFRTELADFSAFRDFDVVVAADGANSLARRHFAEAFRPRVRWGRSKYAWFGTTQVFDAFTFLFRQCEHGLFQAHIYPHLGAASTMVVECDEATWRRAGLDRASEAESLACCETVFADDLRGRSMLANKSDWLSFPTIWNRTWRHGNVVLLGDAAHTAHFGIGSGTKLAMEDAIALAAAFERRGEDPERAFADYELERRPVVEALQDAALESMEYFESTRRYIRFERLPFAFHLLTRSSRVSYDELRRRDPAFVEAVDRWYLEANADDAAARGRLVAPPPMWSPLRLREARLPNRVACAPPPTDSARDGLADDRQGARLARLALGGAGLVLTDVLAVAPEGRITPGCPGLWRPEHATALRRVADLVHERSEGKLGVVLSHAGRRGATLPRHGGVDRPLPRGGWELLSASALPATARSPVPRAMDRADMDGVAASFARAARLAAEAGADLLELHFGQGYLLWSFLSPLANVRADRWGGPLEARAAFPLEVFDAVRAAWPETRPLAVRLSTTDWKRGGFEPDEAVTLARWLAERGCDLVHVLSGETIADAAPSYRPYPALLAADRVRNEAGVATLVGWPARTSDEVNGALAAGRADLCLLEPRDGEALPGM